MSEGSKFDKIRKWNPKFLGVGVGVWCLLLFILWIIYNVYQGMMQSTQDSIRRDNAILNREPVALPPEPPPKDDTVIDIVIPRLDEFASEGDR